MPDGIESERLLRQIAAGQVVEAVPWRNTRSARGQAHFPGLYWSATTGRHVVYESRLELARLLLADFDPDVVAICAQPFLLYSMVDGRMRRHVPDFFLVHADGSATVVNVKPAVRLAHPEVAAALAWPGRLFDERGWGYEIWSGEDPVYLANVRFLAAYRRPGLVSDGLLDVVLAAVIPGDCVGSLINRLGPVAPSTAARPAILRLLWERQLVTDLHRRLDAGSRLEVSV